MKKNIKMINTIIIHNIKAALIIMDNIMGKTIHTIQKKIPNKFMVVIKIIIMIIIQN